MTPKNKRINFQNLQTSKIPPVDHPVTEGGCKNAVEHFWELILQFQYALWELSEKVSKIIKKMNSSVMSGAKRPRLKY
jgi:hypothetical protein